DCADLAHLVGITLGELARANVDAVLQPDADVAAHAGADSGEVDLVPASRQDRPLVVLAKQTVRRSAHMHQIFRIRSDAAQHAEYRLHEERRFEQLAVYEMG